MKKLFIKFGFAALAIIIAFSCKKTTTTTPVSTTPATMLDYTTANGLAANWVLSIVVDAQGNKWIGTENGVSKFDGTNWTTLHTWPMVWSIISFIALP